MVLNLHLRGDVQLAVPTLNVNGTSKQQLMHQLLHAIDAIDRAVAAVRNARPHGRDYFEKHAFDSLQAALNEHKHRLAKLTEVRDELSRLAEAIDQQPAPLGRQ